MIELVAMVTMLAAPFGLGWYGGSRLVARDPVGRSAFARVVRWTVIVYGGAVFVLAAVCFVSTSQAREIWGCMSCPVFAAGPLVGLLLVGVADWIMRGRPETSCRWCGYDLKGSPGGRCPECGADGPGGPDSAAQDQSSQTGP